jgi:hypothetical protein
MAFSRAGSGLPAVRRVHHERWININMTMGRGRGGMKRNRFPGGALSFLERDEVRRFALALPHEGLEAKHRRKNPVSLDGGDSITLG